MIAALAILTAYVSYLALCGAVSAIIHRRNRRCTIRRRLGIVGRRTR